ncbi:hypothetical protein QJS66_22780 [Kocuria rhizophila]|nr:hypothetical protein QJS66_22780 [Kocuria rhizophila]
MAHATPLSTTAPLQRRAAAPHHPQARRRVREDQRFSIDLARRWWAEQAARAVAAGVACRARCRNGGLHARSQDRTSPGRRVTTPTLRRLMVRVHTAWGVHGLARTAHPRHRHGGVVRRRLANTPCTRRHPRRQRAGDRAGRRVRRVPSRGRAHQRANDTPTAIATTDAELRRCGRSWSLDAAPTAGLDSFIHFKGGAAPNLTGLPTTTLLTDGCG